MLNGIINIDADTYVLDAFAGGGTLGFEAISRGARDVIFMDKSRQACATISRNAKMLGLDKGAFCMDVDDFLDMTTDRFDLIFLDPPYDNYDPGYIDDFRSVLMWGGIMVVSHPGEQPTEVDGLTILKSRKYARAMITIYQRNEDDPDGEMMDEGLYWARREKNDERGYLGL